MADPSVLLPLTPSQRQICKRAIELFGKSDYSGCADLYAEVSANRPTDYRSKHNRLVAQFWANGCCGVDQFYNQFMALLREASVSVENISSEDIANPVLLFNLAVLYNHDKQPKKALDILEELFRTFDSLDGQLPKRVGLLKVELLYKLQRYNSAIAQIRVIESQLNYLNEDSDDISPTSSEVGVADAEPKTAYEMQFDEAMRIKLQEFKVMCLLALQSLTEAKKEYKYLVSISTCPAEKYTVGLYIKAYYSYLRGNVKKALAIINTISDNSNESFFETGDNTAMIFNNNVGCCHFALGKPTISAWYFQKASQECDKPEYKDRQKLPLHCLSFNKKYAITYNFGISLLRAKQAQEAFNVLCRCQATFPTNPKLWLRIAECCVQLYKSSNEEDFTWTEEKRNILRGNLTDNTLAISRKEACLSRERHDTEKPKPTLTYALHCIEIAIRLIDSEIVRNENCVHVKPSNPITNPMEIRALHANILCTGAYLALTLSNFSYAITLCKELLAMEDVPNAYHYLGKLYLGEALFKRGDVNESILTLTEDNTCNYELRYSVSPTDRDRDDAASGCSGCRRENEGRSSSQSPSSSSSNKYAELKPSQEWYPKDEQTARSVFVYNRAVALTKVGRYVEAANLIETWSHGANSHTLPPQFLILNIHLNWKMGKADKAKALLRQYCPTTPNNLSAV